MLPAHLALRAAIRDALLADGALTSALGGSRVYDELGSRFGLTGITAPDSIDHLLTRNVEVVSPVRAWPPEARELPEDGLALRLSDHAPVELTLRLDVD